MTEKRRLLLVITVSAIIVILIVLTVDTTVQHWYDRPDAASTTSKPVRQ